MRKTDPAENYPANCSANQWTGFYMITASILKGLNKMIEAEIINLMETRKSIYRNNSLY